MHDDDAPTASPEQDAYVAAALACRAELLARLPDLPAMTVDEIDKLADTIDDVMRFEMKSRLWDKRMQAEESRGMPCEYPVW